MKNWVIAFLFCVRSCLAVDYYINSRGPSDGLADDAAIIQKNIDNAPDYSLIVWPSDYHASIARTIVLRRRTGIVIATPTRRASNEPSGPGMKWTGGIGGTMFSFERARYCSILGLALDAHPDTENAARVAVDIDGYSPGISTRNEVGFCYIRSHGTPNPNFIGVRISATATQNNEFMSVHDNTITALGGIGIQNGASANAKNQYFTHNDIFDSRIGIQMLNGSMRVEDFTGGNNDIDIEIHNGTEPIVIDNVSTEHSKQGIVVIDGPTAGISIENCRADNGSQVGPFFDFSRAIGQQSVILRNNVFEALPPNGTTVVDCGGPTSVHSYHLLGNYWHPTGGMTESQAGFGTIGWAHSATSENEAYLLDRPVRRRSFGEASLEGW